MHPKENSLNCWLYSHLVIPFALIVLLIGIVISLSTGSAVAAGAAADNTLDRILRSKKLVVGYINFPPAVFKDVSSGSVKGHFADTIEEIAKQIDVKVEYVESTWSTFAAGLKNGQFDLSIAPTFSTIPRATSVAFTRPLMYVGNGAIVRKGEARFKSIEDIDKPGIVVAVTQGEAGHEFAKANIKHAKIVVLSQSEQALTLTQVSAGRADIALGDSYVTTKFAKEHSGEVEDIFSQNPYNLTPVGWATRRGDTEFLNFINTSLEVLETTGALAKFENASGAHWLHMKRTWVVD